MDLRAEVRRLQAHVRALEESLRMQADKSFREKVRYERDRSQRYNNFFAIISIECDKSRDASEVAGMVRKCVRNVDVVDVLLDEEPADGAPTGGGPDREERLRIGVLLPHANKEVARIASERIVTSLNHGFRKSAFAVYPDDATDWTRLISMVME